MPVKSCDLTNAEMRNCPGFAGTPGEECDYFETGKCYRRNPVPVNDYVKHCCGTCRHFINQNNVGGYGFCDIKDDGTYYEVRFRDNSECKFWEVIT